MMGSFLYAEKYRHKFKPQTKEVGGEKLYKLFVINKQFSTNTMSKYQLQVQFVNEKKTKRRQYVCIPNDQIVLKVADWLWIKEACYLKLSENIKFIKN